MEKSNSVLPEGALSGVTVIDFSRLLPGPLCSMILADHGARVISVEDRRFAAQNLFFSTVNRNKEHMTLNLKSEEGREIFFGLVEKADVLMEGFRPGVMERLGAGYEAVSAANDRIVYCSISGYGATGPLRDRPGHDVNYLARCGLLDMIGKPEDPPVIPNFQAADVIGGSMNAAVGILLALLARERTGKGQFVDISMTDGALYLLALPLYRHFEAKEPQRRWDTFLSHRFACYNTYETADGRCLSVGAVEPVFWEALCRDLGLEEYTLLQFDEERREEIIAAFRSRFRERPLDEWAGFMEKVEACCEPALTLEEAMDDPHFKSRGMVLDFPDEAGSTRPTLGVAAKLSRTPGSVRTPPVPFGRSTRSVLAELGYADGEIQGFFDRGAV